MTQYTELELQKILDNVSLVDYFYHLESQGTVKFDKKYGKDYYFISENGKYSVTDDGFYDFKSGKGGQTIKAVMEFENKSWKEAVDFLKDFGNTTIDADFKKRLAERRQRIDKISKETKSETKIIRSIVPNNKKLIEYFEDRGISKEVLKENTKQVHYEVKGRQYFGIGLENQSKGIEIRNPMMKSKIGKNDFTIIEGTDESKMFVFEGMTDMLSFLQLLKDNNRENNHTLICLNSVTNIDKFIEKNKDYNGKMFLILDGDEAGNNATQKILEAFKDKDVKDVRLSYNIQLGGNNDLNDYLKKKLERNKKSNNLANKNVENENTTSNTRAERISNSQQMGSGTFKQHIDPISSQSQPKQGDRGNNGGGQDLFSTNVGNGLTGTEKLDAGLRRAKGSNRGRQNTGGKTLEDEGRIRTTSLETTNIPELDKLIQEHKGQKLTNEQVAELVSVACFVDDRNRIQLNENLRITDDLKDLVKQYKTGGIAKQGRGVLDEYYTNKELVEVVKNLLNNEFDKNNELNRIDKNDIDYSTINANKLAIGTTFEIPIYNNQKMIIVDKSYDIDENDIGNTLLHLTDENNVLDSKTNTITLTEFREKAFNVKPPFSILEPSVGTGNFLNAIENLSNTNINTFEINETTAKISKILFPNITVNLRSFETEFIDDNGFKRDKSLFSEKYDLVIGNPPYGDHRGLYKGLGEEPKISKYEDYFIKRSLDSMKENGVLAMVLPSGWLNRQKRLNNAELINAYRLPVGSFAGTQIGTDIVLLKKDSQVQNIDISKYFEKNPNKVLGEIREKNNRFGKLEKYVHGSLDEALATIRKDSLQTNETIKAEELKNGTYYRTFAIKKEDGLPIEEYESKDKNEILQHYEEMKKDSSNAIIDYEERVYQNNIVVNSVDNKISSGVNNKTSEKNAKTVKKQSFQFSLFDSIERNSSLDYLKHHKELKSENPNTLFLFEVEGYYESYGNDAKILAEKLNLELLPKNEEEVFVKFPDYSLDTYLQKFKKYPGLSIGICTEIKSRREFAIEKTQMVLDKLNEIKFKTPSVLKETEKYTEINSNLKNTQNNFTEEKLQEIITKSDRIINSRLKKKVQSEYEIQTEPKIKKGVLKYQFSKNDSIVNTALQNNPNLTKEQIEAFKNANYDGTLNDPIKHSKYANYSKGEWVHDFYYAEGNIYSKLKQLERDKHAINEQQYQKQKALLESVLPTPKKLEDIIISPNHEFVHKFKLGEREVEKRRQNYGISGVRWETYTEIEDFTLAHKFKDFVKDLPAEAYQSSSYWEIQEFVDNVTVTGSDRERNALVRERRKEVANDLFKRFIREEMTTAEKEKFVNDFNRNYNNIYIPNYNEFPLFSKIHYNFKGKPLKLAEVQKGGVGRLITKGVGALAHEVGFGKTLSGVLAMHEAMERKTAKRPLIVVPNDNILKQWVETIYEVIPNAKMNVLGNLGKGYDLSNFDNKDNEITIVTYSGFNNIGFNKEITNNLAGQFSYISENETKIIKNSDDSIIVKQESEREKQKRIARKDEVKGKMKKGKVYDWEDFGFDHLTFDEVHNANHIVGKVRIEDRRFASDFRSQNQRTSALGINTWMASQYIQENYDGRNVTLLSATPFTNKPLEYYSVLSLIANNRLEEKGYFNVNTFFETFMEADNEMEIDAVGKVKNKSNVKRFKNNAVFQQLLGEFIDIKGEEDNPKLIRPNRINKEYKIKQNDITKEQYELLNENYNDEDKGAILKHISSARLIAISPYLSPYYDGEKPTFKKFVKNSPKLKTTMDLIAQNKKDNPSAGQIIYSELAVDKFPNLKEYLVNEIGFNKKEVAIITGKTSKSQRQKIQEDFNEGKIKVVIGSSAIKEGMNLQENTSDMYLLSLPYNFTALRQVEGRGWRQGNKFENVRINYMLTEDSIDVFMLQKLQTKQSRYLEAMKKDVNILDISDIDTQELKTALITNPHTRAEIEAKIQNKRLESEKSRLLSDASFTVLKLNKVKEIEKNIKKYEDETEWISKNYAPKSEKYKKEVVKRKQVAEKWKNDLKIQMEKQKIDLSVLKENEKQISEKLEKLEKKIEELPTWKEKLVQKYIKERIEKDKEYNCIDFTQERAEENKTFYKIRRQTENISEVKEESQRYFRRR